MWIYIFKRLCLIIPTLLGIMTLNFFIVQMAPGGPVEQMLSKIEHNVLQGETSMGGFSYKKEGIDIEMLAKINALYGFDKTLGERYWLMLKKYLLFDFGESFIKTLLL